jgi:uncharacterized protein (TIGR02246 family)
LQLSRRATITGGLAAGLLAGLPRSESAWAQTAADESAIRKYVENFDAAWNRHDAVGLFGKRAREMDRINAFGGWIRDPEADERVMSRLFAGPFGQNKRKTTAERIRFVTPDVALVVVHVITNAGPSGVKAPSLGDRSLHVLVKHNGEWELTGFANVPIIPPSGAIREAEGDDVFYSDPKH